MSSSVLEAHAAMLMIGSSQLAPREMDCSSVGGVRAHTRWRDEFVEQDCFCFTDTEEARWMTVP